MKLRTKIEIVARAAKAAVVVAIVAAVAMVASAAGANVRSLDSESIREAYFLGQRGDETTARFLANMHGRSRCRSQGRISRR